MPVTFFIVTLLTILTSPQLSLATEEGRSVDYLPNILSLRKGNEKIGVFINEQNKKKREFIWDVFRNKISQEKVLMKNEKIIKLHISADNIKTPILEFKKINPTKYRVRVHEAAEDFPLIFSETFHQGWKLYVSEGFKADITKLGTVSSDPSPGTSNPNQATLEEVKKFIANGWISTVGQKGSKSQNGNDKVNSKNNTPFLAKFISKNVRDTIQNDNIPDGSIYETWFEKHLSDNFHWKVNGFANSWWIKLDDIKKTGNYLKGDDGSIDFELIIDFWPQRLLYAGYFISGSTVLTCLLLLFYFRRNSNPKTNKYASEKT